MKLIGIDGILEMSQEELRQTNGGIAAAVCAVFGDLCLAAYYIGYSAGSAARDAEGR